MLWIRLVNRTLPKLAVVYSKPIRSMHGNSFGAMNCNHFVRARLNIVHEHQLFRNILALKSQIAAVVNVRCPIQFQAGNRAFCRVLPLDYSGARRAGSTLAASREARLQSEQDQGEFFAQSSLSFRDLGVSEPIAGCLASAGFDRPSRTQELAFDALRNGKTAVIAAETGSGKTLAYLAPMLDSILRTKKEREEAEKGDILIPPDPESMLILCPNLVLCEQVHQVIERVFNSSSNGDKAMIRSTVVSSRSPPPYQFPDVVITTPGALFSLVFESGGALGHEWTKDGFAELIRYVVLDECDMLLGGSFGKQIEQIMEMLRTGDRQRAAQRACEEIGVDLEAYWTLPRHLRKVAQLQGGKGLVEEGVEDFLKVSVDLQESSTWLRQYAFVAATIPSEGKETIGARIKRDYPEAIWLSSDGVHKLLNTVEFRWREVAGIDEKIDEIMAIIEDLEANENAGKILVFAGNSNSARLIASRLSEIVSGDPGKPLILEYHSGVNALDRSESLRMIHESVNGDKDIVLVCTDSASRGIDIQDVAHIVQADFASSAIDFLHRAGRTGRAGKSGMVTSLIAENDADLATVIKEMVENNALVDGAFSRNRSFRKKFKRYGKFIPRGE